jgi:CheY-like chemotaxis protein
MATEGFFSVDSLAGVHVLVVDDDADARELLSAVVRYCGALVTTVGTAGEALQVMAVIKCDVLVVDASAPSGEGLRLMRAVRKLKPENGGVVRAIALSGVDRAQDRDEALAAGFDSHLTKPVDPWQLCRLVSTLALRGRS